MKDKRNGHSPLVYAVVLNWNGANDAIGCLHSLVQQDWPNLVNVLVDNGSADDSVVRIQAEFPNLKILQNDKNLGFAGGVNVGMHYALEQNADQIIVLNNDLVLDPKCISEMMAHVEKDVSFVTASLYFHDEPNRIWSIGGELNKWNLEKTADARGILDENQFPQVMRRDFVPGGATLMSAKVLREIGLFDEKFFLYYEDADLSLRAYRAGYKSLVVTTAKMWHGVSKSSGGADSPRERYWMARSSTIYFSKNAKVWQWPIIFFWRSGSAIRTSIRLLKGRRHKALCSYWRGLKDGVREGFSA
ncbi:MAG: GT2 family glycosyltransferase [Cellvibrionaceae bacterium]|jgi:GT2 family glycosyltransferase